MQPFISGVGSAGVVGVVVFFFFVYSAPEVSMLTNVPWGESRV